MIHSEIPDPPATLETVNAKLNHLITVVEVLAKQVERVDDQIVSVEKTEKRMMTITRNLSNATLQLSAARIAAAILPAPRAMLVMSTGAFLGGLVGSVAWQWLHAASAFAH